MRGGDRACTRGSGYHECRLHVHFRQHRSRSRASIDGAARVRGDSPLQGAESHRLAVRRNSAERAAVTTSLLQVADERSVAYLRVHEPVALGLDADRLAWEIVDTCRQVQES